MDFLPGNAQHIGAREVQQDRFGFSDLRDEAFRRHGGLLAVVADGIGGLEQGEAASQAAVQTFLDAYGRKAPEETIPDALQRALREANQAVYEMGCGTGAPGDIGTTLVAAVGHEDKLFWISVGDSHILLAREAQLTLLNQEHVYGRALRERVDAGEIGEEEAGRHPDRGSLTSYLGMAELAEVDRTVRPLPLKEGDRILLASDGLSKTLEPKEILGMLEGAAQEVAAKLVAAALGKKRPHQDNITVIVLNAVPKASPATAAELPKTRGAAWKLGLLGGCVILAAGASWWTWTNWLCCGPAIPAECCDAPQETDPSAGRGMAGPPPVIDGEPSEPAVAPSPDTGAPEPETEVKAAP